MAEQAEAPALPHAVPASALGASSRSTAPLVNDEALALAGAPQALVDRSCHTLLCLEMSRAVAASAAFKVRRANEIVEQLRSDDPGAHVPPPLSQADETDMARSRMEAIGLHVGRCLTERLCRTKSRFQDTLDVFKFVCKELWHAVWDKQIDNLRTNHRGVFVLQDNVFRPFQSLGPSAQAEPYAALQLAYATGLVQGALAALGVQASVTADMALPQCTFHIRVTT